MLAHRIDDNSRTKDVTVVENVTFESLLLSENVLKGLKKSGFKKPSPVQLKAIPVGRCGFDLIVKSKSGTGKTLVFSIIALESLKLKKDKLLEVLIVSPTREIAVQSQEVIKLIGCYFEDLKVESFIGGLSLAEDKEKCKICNIAVGTPGRIKQLISLKSLNTNSIRLFVLDEADKLMENSFRNDINEIYNSLPPKKQIITTSATYPNQLDEFLSKYMLSPTHINAEIDSPLLLGLKQFVVITKPTPTVVQLMKLKTEELVKIITNISFTQCLVFSNYQTRAESLSNILNQKGWPSTYISAAQTQPQRLEAVNKLKDFKCRIMLSTDLTARGIDAANVDLVINYDIPLDAMTYLHRMGRAGRYGSSGVCINLASEGPDLLHLQEILGNIGGTALSIPKLTTFNGSVSDLLKIEVPKEDHVYGIVNPEKTDTPRNKVFEILKKENKVNKNEDIINILNETEEITKKISNMDADSSLNSLLNQDKNETEEIRKKISDMDADSILNSLLNQDFKMETTENNIEEFDLNAVLKSLTDTATSKAKTPAKNKVTEVDVREQMKDDLLIKNKALLNVSKILSGSNVADDQIAIEKHLLTIKSRDKNEINELSKKDTDDLLNILTSVTVDEAKPSTSKITDSDETAAVDFEESIEEIDDVQNLFQFGYKNIVLSSNNRWREALMEVLKTPVTIEQNEDEDDDYDDEESTEDEDSEEISSNKDKSEACVKKKVSIPGLEEHTKDVERFAEEENELEDIEYMSMYERTGAKKKVKNEKTDREEDRKGRKNKKSSEMVDENEFRTVCSEDFEETIDESLWGKKSKAKKKKKSLKMHEENENETEVDIMKWVPVENCQKSCDTIKRTCLLESEGENSVETSEQYTPYFEECSSHLWQNGMSFDSVEAFDEWFYYEWEAQLYSVRNFVQQNVYIGEMAKYQNYWKGNKDS